MLFTQQRRPEKEVAFGRIAEGKSLPAKLGLPNDSMGYVAARAAGYLIEGSSNELFGVAA